MAPNPKAVNKKIRIIIERYGNYLKFHALGPSSLTGKELADLVQSGLVKPTAEVQTLVEAYLASHQDSLGATSRKAVRDYAQRHIKESGGKYIDKYIEKMKHELGEVISNNFLTERNHMIAGAQDILAERGNKGGKQIAMELRDKLGSLSKDWDRIVTTELAQATNLGSFDAIVENNKGRDPNEIYVYKSGPHDGRTCDACARFWFLRDAITPRVYRLSDLMSGGSNIGKKKADWVPTIGNTHPNERHYLLSLPNGWGFRGGALVYIGKNHNEYEAQQGHT